MGNNMREAIIDIDLNQEPLDRADDSDPGLEAILSELETAHEQIEERIRQLEAVTIRARPLQGHGWRQAQTPAPQPIDTSAGPSILCPTTDTAALVEEGSVNDQKTIRKRSIHLVAKALGINTDARNTRRRKGGALYDCNVCGNMARDPILTSCGHLFCWACYYKLSYSKPETKECPACYGEVADTSIIPVYGNGNGNASNSSKSKESTLLVPPRPHAHRRESVRQQMVSRGESLAALEEATIRVISTIGASRGRSGPLDFDHLHGRNERTDFSAGGIGVENDRPYRSIRFSRLLRQGAASFSSLSSALGSAMDSAERIVGDLEAYIQNNHTRRIHEQSSAVNDGAVEPNHRSSNAAEFDSNVNPSASSSRSSENHGNSRRSDSPRPRDTVPDYPFRRRRFR